MPCRRATTVAVHSAALNSIRPRVLLKMQNETCILRVLAALQGGLRTPARVLICYDFEEDDTLAAVRQDWKGPLAVEFVRNRGRGAHGAAVTGLRSSTAPFALVFPADDDYNADILETMVAKAMDGHEVVCASRFMPGGSIVGCPWLKASLVRTAAFTLHRFAGIPTHDATMASACSRVASSTPFQSSRRQVSPTASNGWRRHTASVGPSLRCRRDGSSGNRGRAASRFFDGSPPICAGTFMPSPRRSAGGRRAAWC
jgi:hypothetical protein